MPVVNKDDWEVLIRIELCMQVEIGIDSIVESIYRGDSSLTEFEYVWEYSRGLMFNTMIIGN